MADIDWKKIEEKSYSVPLVPEINKEYICSEFKKLEEEVENLNRYENVQEESL